MFWNGEILWNLQYMIEFDIDSLLQNAITQMYIAASVHNNAAEGRQRKSNYMNSS